MPAEKVPNPVLRRVRELERQETRAEFAEAITRKARELGESVAPGERYMAKLEDGDVRYPYPVYRRVLTALCGRSMAELGFTSPLAARHGQSGDVAGGERDVPGLVPLPVPLLSPEEERSEMAARLGAARMRRRLTKREMARRIIPHVTDQCPSLDSVLSYVKRWEAGRSGITERYRFACARALDMDEEQLFGLHPLAQMADLQDSRHASEALADRISELVAWVEETNMGDGTLGYLDGATSQLAHDCLSTPPIRSHERAASLTRRVFDLLRSGHQRIGQTRDLYVIAGKLCAVLSWVSSDLGQLVAAEGHIRNGWTLAEQADHNGLRALLLCARSKNAFWNSRYADAAMYARRGYEYDPPGTARVLLACQESDALQALGKIDEARKVLDLAERSLDNIREADELGGIFGCGAARQANYSIATYLRAGSVKQALREVERAEAAWRNGEEWAYGTWAQVQIGAAIAHLMSGEVEAAATILQQILDEPAERHLATLTTRLRREVTPLLENPAMKQAKAAIMLCEGIAYYGMK
jgi:tetratricopeptide (TPR) repeat protein